MGLFTGLRNSIAQVTSSLFSGGQRQRRIGIYGPPNAGKCLAPEESVLLADGTHRTIEELFADARARGACDVSEKPTETWLDCADLDVQVPALTEDLSVEPTAVSHVFRQEYSGPMYRVRTRRGRDVTVSPEHPFIAVTDDGVSRVRAGDVSTGTKVALLSSFVPTDTDWCPAEVPDGDTLLSSDGGAVTYDATHHEPKSIAPVGLDEDLARFLALVIAESQHDERFVGFANEDPRLREAFRSTVARFGIETTTYDYEEKTPVVRANSRSLVEYLKRFDCHPGSSAEKRVPDSVLTADDAIVRAFLRALFDCEGSVQGAASDERGRYVTMASASRDLLVGVQTLLLRFDIVAALRRKTHDGTQYFELSIGRSDQHRAFREAIGFGQRAKADRLDVLCDAGSKATVHSLPILPRLEQSRAALGMTQAAFYGDDKHVARMRRRNSITIDRITSMAASLPEHPETELVRTLADADVTWDEVVAIEEIDYEGYIYDLTVPSHHTFATRDGLVVHNTTLANRIARDWTGDAVGPESRIPHETRRARRKEDIEIERNGKSVSIDIVDTPGVTTKVDYTEFLEHDMEEDDAVRRSREATEGVAEAMHWLREDVDGVIYVLDAAEDPFTQVNTMLVGIIESQDLPVLIFANKIDLDEASVQRITNAFPQHETVPLSALEGDNMDEVYDKIAEYFG
jgi:intein/homing endonuclease